MNIFQKASKIKLRFAVRKGYVTVEDLWDLSLEDLDEIAIEVNQKVKESREESFIKKQSRASTTDLLRLEILKSIINYKMEESEKKMLAKQRQEELSLLQSMIADKKIEEMKSLSTEEIQARIEALKEEV